MLKTGAGTHCTMVFFKPARGVRIDTKLVEAVTQAFVDEHKLGEISLESDGWWSPRTKVLRNKLAWWVFLCCTSVVSGLQNMWSGDRELKDITRPI